MAGGEGTRLRPLTSNQPKPMVPIVGKPCMEHILELLARHGIDRRRRHGRVPAAGDPHLLRRRLEPRRRHRVLGRGDPARHRRLGAPRERAARRDVPRDLGRRALRHRPRPDRLVPPRKGAAVTIGLKAVENPLEFGIVVTDEDGRVERFLEKPSWGQVFTDTINTGIYVLEPEVLEHVPTDRPFDFSKELFPLLLEHGPADLRLVCDGYWQDIGNLDQYRQANFDALDEKVELSIDGLKIRGDVWLGEGVEIDDVEGVEGPAFIGTLLPDRARRVGRPVLRPRPRRRRCASARACRAA